MFKVISFKQILDRLLNDLTDVNPFVRENAAWALGKTSRQSQSKEASGVLIEAPSDEDIERIVDGLFIALTDEDSYVRANAAGALVIISSEQTVDSLHIAFTDENISERTVDSLLIALTDKDIRLVGK